MRQSTRGPAAPDPKYARLKTDLHRTVVEAVDLSRLDRWKPERVRSEVQSLALDMAKRENVKLSSTELDRLSGDVLDEVFGLGPIQPLLQDPAVTEVLVNGPKSVFFEKNGRLTRSDIEFADNAHVTRIIQRVVAKIGRRIDESSPMVDARLPDGSRVNAVLPPLTADGPVLSIRKFGQILSHEDLLKSEALTPEMLGFLKAAVVARANILISGGTGAGKTTLLNVLSGFIPHGERLVTIEDTLELKLNHPHVVRTETRPSNLEGHGAVAQRDLLRNALRMRPDRIIVGEVRGAEVVDMLQAMNTGHEGSLATVHANGTRDALNRLEMMVAMAGFDVPVPVLRGYVASALNLVVHLSRLTGGERKVVRISELRGLGKARGGYVLKDVFEFEQTGLSNGAADGNFKALGYAPKLLARLHAAGTPLPADLFKKRDLSTGTAVDLRGN